MRACRSDLMNHAIWFDTATPGEMRALVREHLDYFQAMMGYDATVGGLVSLATRIRLKSARPAVCLMGGATAEAGP